MVTVTNEELFAIDRAAAELLQNAMPAQTAVRIRLALKPLQNVLGEVKTVYQLLSDRHAKRSNDGQIVQQTVINNEGQPVQIPVYADEEGYNKEYRELMDMETEIEPFPINGIKMTTIQPKILFDLGDFLTGAVESGEEKATIRIGDITKISGALRELGKKEMPFAKAKKLWRIVRQLKAISETATEEREALIAQHARLNDDGERIYLDRQRERVDVGDAFYKEEKMLFDRAAEIEGIPLAFITEVEQQHGLLPGAVTVMLGDLLLLPPEEANADGTQEGKEDE